MLIGDQPWHVTVVPAPNRYPGETLSRFTARIAAMEAPSYLILVRGARSAAEPTDARPLAVRADRAPWAWFDQRLLY